MNKRLTKPVAMMLLTTAMAFGLTACSDDNTTAEDVGEHIDQTVTDTGNAIEDKCEDVKEAAGAEDTDC